MKTRGFVFDQETSLAVAVLLLGAASKGAITLLTGHYNGNGPTSGFHGTVLIPGAHALPGQLPQGEQVLYLGTFRAAKLVPRTKPAGSSVGFKLTDDQCVLLAGYLLVAAMKLKQAAGRKFVCVTCFSHCQNSGGYHTSITLE